ncbi:uncharacterized protein LOC114770939 [Denticeps clupeoides]|uniref:uncharacterized protein LOC114770939 n=1 Tax=Denticeps clupeoides TaxID=299321 RepID=UPI0010A494C5|nr:uncharacterized protein LOC114770939 [Denticeps clupeoides]XP_028820717.1 uncharacterized protein LOC114770939 [Denticeps clupeoides]
MEPLPEESTLARIGETLWTAWSYITTAVGRFLRPVATEDKNEPSAQEDTITSVTTSQRRNDEEAEHEDLHEHDQRSHSTGPVERCEIIRDYNQKSRGYSIRYSRIVESCSQDATAVGETFSQVDDEKNEEKHGVTSKDEDSVMEECCEIQSSETAQMPHTQERVVIDKQLGGQKPVDGDKMVSLLPNVPEETRSEECNEDKEFQLDTDEWETVKTQTKREYVAIEEINLNFKQEKEQEDKHEAPANDTGGGKAGETQPYENSHQPTTEEVENSQHFQTMEGEDNLATGDQCVGIDTMEPDLKSERMDPTLTYTTREGHKNHEELQQNEVSSRTHLIQISTDERFYGAKSDIVEQALEKHVCGTFIAFDGKDNIPHFSDDKNKFFKDSNAIVNSLEDLETNKGETRDEIHVETEPKTTDPSLLLSFSESTNEDLSKQDSKEQENKLLFESPIRKDLPENLILESETYSAKLEASGSFKANYKASELSKLDDHLIKQRQEESSETKTECQEADAILKDEGVEINNKGSIEPDRKDHDTAHSSLENKELFKESMRIETMSEMVNATSEMTFKGESEDGLHEEQKKSGYKAGLLESEPVLSEEQTQDQSSPAKMDSVASQAGLQESADEDMEVDTPWPSLTAEGKDIPDEPSEEAMNVPLSDIIIPDQERISSPELPEMELALLEKKAYEEIQEVSDSSLKETGYDIDVNREIKTFVKSDRTDCKVPESAYEEDEYFSEKIILQSETNLNLEIYLKMTEALEEDTILEENGNKNTETDTTGQKCSPKPEIKDIIHSTEFEKSSHEAEPQETEPALLEEHADEGLQEGSSPAKTETMERAFLKEDSDKESDEETMELNAELGKEDHSLMESLVTEGMIENLRKLEEEAQISTKVETNEEYITSINRMDVLNYETRITQEMEDPRSMTDVIRENSKKSSGEFGLSEEDTMHSTNIAQSLNETMGSTTAMIKEMTETVPTRESVDLPFFESSDVQEDTAKPQQDVKDMETEQTTVSATIMEVQEEPGMTESHTKPDEETGSEIGLENITAEQDTMDLQTYLGVKTAQEKKKVDDLTDGAETLNAGKGSAIKRRLEHAEVDIELDDPESQLNKEHEDLKLQVEASTLDFTFQRSRIAVKNPNVRPPKDPRTLLKIPSLLPSPKAEEREEPPSCSPEKKDQGPGVVVRGVKVVGFQLPGLGGGLPVLRKTNVAPRVKEEDNSETPDRQENCEQSEETPKPAQTQSKPKWTPPRHPGLGSPMMMAELKNKLRTTPKE